MAFKLARFLYPFLLYLVLTLAIFMLFPMEKKTTDKVYNYNTKQDEFRTEKDYTPILIEVALTTAFFIYLASLSDLPKYSIMRDFITVLYDSAVEKTLSAEDVYAPFQTPHDQYLGEWNVGNVGLGIVNNIKGARVFMLYIQNSDYATTEVRPQRTNPILSHSTNFATVEDAIRTFRPSMRASEERAMENMLRKLRGAPSEKKEYLKARAEKAIEDEEAVENE